MQRLWRQRSVLNNRKNLLRLFAQASRARVNLSPGSMEACCAAVDSVEKHMAPYERRRRKRREVSFHGIG